VVPVSTSQDGAKVGARLPPEKKEEGAGKVEGDAVMLTPCSGRAEKGWRREFDA